MSTFAPSCPRCGYDQCGAIAAWERTDPPACPLSGRCTECGLEFLWRDLLNPVFTRHLKLIEHARSRIIPSALLTYDRCFYHREFWSWLTMSHDIEPHRLAWFCGFAALATYLLTTAALAGGWIAAWKLAPFGLYADEPSALRAVTPAILMDSPRWFYEPAGGVHPLALIALGAALLMPVPFLLLPQTLRAARIRRAHLARIWAYSLVSLPLALSAALLLRLAFQLTIGACSFLGYDGELEASFFDAFQHLRWWSVPAVTLVWTFLWWSAAARLYLRLDRPRTTAALMVAVAALVTLAILVLVYPGGGWMLYNLDRP